MNKIVIVPDGTTIRNCRFAFKCNMLWVELKETDDPDIRHCDHCNNKVYRCNSDKDIGSAIRQNRCLAILPYYDDTDSLDGAMVGRLMDD